ncbi:hypothetical protein HanRHA438_Chr03g0139331 [Helianthus annuus]|nr:hypothetical protein HanIR_Chr03g0139221 [Helianthus annuus]KAJ0937189.1 hypothetical protein HanRHA438_Chr03g0139331 [Helianthus annuus]
MKHMFTINNLPDQITTVDTLKTNRANRFIRSTIAADKIIVRYNWDFVFDGGGDDVDGDREERGGGAVEDEDVVGGGG